MQEIDLLKKAIQQYENSPKSAIDMDLLLDGIRQGYALLLVQKNKTTEVPLTAEVEEKQEAAATQTATEEKTAEINADDYFELAEEPEVNTTIIEEPVLVEKVAEEFVAENISTTIVEEVPSLPKEEEVITATQIVEEIKEPLPIAEEPIKVEEPIIEKINPAILNESFSQQTTASFNEKLQTNTFETGLNERFAIGSMKSLIDFNRKFVFIQELFKGDSEAYNVAIDTIDKCENIQSAFHFITTSVLPTYKWDMNASSVKLFDKLVRQKFGKL